MGKHFSKKHFSKKQRRALRGLGTAEIINFQGGKFEEERILPPIKPLNATQEAYLDALRSCPQTIVLGPAGAWRYDDSASWSRLGDELTAVMGSTAQDLNLNVPAPAVILMAGIGAFPRTAIIISHDRDLLDECVDHILHLDRGKLSIYRGGYTSFARQVADAPVIEVPMGRNV